MTLSPDNPSSSSSYLLTISLPSPWSMILSLVMSSLPLEQLVRKFLTGWHSWCLNGYIPRCALKYGSLLITSPTWHRYNANKVSSFSTLSVQISSSNDLEFLTKSSISCAIDKASQYIMLNLSSTVFCIYKKHFSSKEKEFAISAKPYRIWSFSNSFSPFKRIDESCSFFNQACSLLPPTPHHFASTYQPIVLHSHLLSAKHLTSNQPLSP